MNRKISDRDMTQHFAYHKKLVRLCQAIASICDDASVFNRYTPKDLRPMMDNQIIRWRLEDRIRDLLRKNGDYPDAAMKGRK